MKALRRSRRPVSKAVALLLFTRFCRLVSQRLASDSFSALNDICPGVTVVQNSSNGTTWFTDDVAALLFAVDHTFVLTKVDCVQTVPNQLSDRVTCVRGHTLDACAPRKYIQAATSSMSHALRVTFAHAYILQRAHQAGYDSIAILEADAVFVQRHLSETTVAQVHKLLESQDWSILRVGFRPYFLERNAVHHCPSRCRCTITAQYGESVCKLRGTGCDMRSSDFYIIRSDEFQPLSRRLLDLRGSSLSRVIDMQPIQLIRKTWLMIPQVSFQRTLDIPLDYQVGQSALYIKKCVLPRPLSQELTRHLQLLITHANKV